MSADDYRPECEALDDLEAAHREKFNAVQAELADIDAAILWLANNKGNTKKMSRTLICECGHAHKMHTEEKCRACPCNNFTVANNIQAAILAGIKRKKESIATAAARRRARLDWGDHDAAR